MVARAEHKRELRGADLPGQCKIITIWDEEMDTKAPVGRAILLYTDLNIEDDGLPRAAFILDIWVQSKNRRQRVATHLVEGIKTMYHEVSTDWRSEAGLQLCLKCGFRTRKIEGARLIWRKDKDDADEIQGAEGVPSRDQTGDGQEVRGQDTEGEEAA